MNSLQLNHVPVTKTGMLIRSADFLTDPLAQARRSVQEAGLIEERCQYAAAYHGADTRR